MTPDKPKRKHTKKHPDQVASNGFVTEQSEPLYASVRDCAARTPSMEIASDENVTSGEAATGPDAEPKDGLGAVSVVLVKATLDIDDLLARVWQLERSQKVVESRCDGNVREIASICTEIKDIRASIKGLISRYSHVYALAFAVFLLILIAGSALLKVVKP